MRIALRALLFGLGALLLLAGCRDAREGFTGQFTEIRLQQAPVEVQRSYERLKALPGLYVFHKGGRTYLLLLAGSADPPGQRVEVLHLQQPVGPTDEVRVLARLLPGGGGDRYPYTILQLDGGEGLRFKARLSTLSEQVLELRGILVADR